MWKDIKFYDLNIEDMENVAVDYADKYKEFDRDVREWGVFVFLKNDIDKFR